MTASEPLPSALSITMFGPMQVRVGGRPLPRLRSRKALWLLALLALRGGRSVEREGLAGTLWPDVEASSAAANLRVVLSELRRALGAEGVRLQSPSRHTLSLETAGADVDVSAFDAAVGSGGSAALERAVALYRGPLLEGCAEEWVGQERIVREQDCLQALETLADAALASGDHAAATGYYRRAVGLDPWREAAQRGLMRALAQGGEGNAALDVYQAFVRLLCKDDPRAAPDEQTTTLYARLRAEARRRASAPIVSAVEEAVAPVVTGYLPHPLTDLVGREDDREEVVGRLRRSRLVTLTGPGGIGKTRLAIEVAAGAAPEYADGVWLVALDALSNGGQVPAQVAGVLGVKEEAGRTLLQGLTDHLRNKRLLLVLDNCEHLLEACAEFVGRFLRECARLQVLATSRQALGIIGEAAWAVPPLSVPDPAHLPTEPATLVRVLAAYEGVQLFVERAQAVQKTFAVTRDNATALARVCARVEGIPLAIELAAARVRAMTLPQMAARLDDRLSLLTGGSRAALPRQQTLWATLDWSYDLLDAPERLLLGRLSVFAGGWDLEAAEGACTGDGVAVSQVLDLLASLGEKSLLIFESREAGGRYRLLEMVRQYAGEQLEAGGMADPWRARHRDWFAALAAQAVTGLRGADQASWLRRLEAERENFRAALTWTGTDAAGLEISLRMAGDMGWFWYIRGHLSEGRHLLDLVLQREEARGPTEARGRALNGAGTLAAVAGDVEAARALFEETLSVFRTLGGSPNVASALGNLGNIAVVQGDYALARERYAESLEISREMGSPQRTAASLGNLAEVALAQSDYAAGWDLETESLEIFRALEDKHGIARTLYGLGNIACRQGGYDKAQAIYQEALALFQELQEQRGISDVVSGLGDIELERGSDDSARALYRESLIMRRDTGLKSGVECSFREFAGLLLRGREPRKAALLWGAAETMRETTGSSLLPPVQRLLERDMAEARGTLGASQFAEAQAEGRALTWEQATAYALAL